MQEPVLLVILSTPPGLLALLPPQCSPVLQVIISARMLASAVPPLQVSSLVLVPLWPSPAPVATSWILTHAHNVLKSTQPGKPVRMLGLP